MKKVIFTIFVVLVAVSTYAQTTGTIKDPRDGKTYKTVTINNQVWMAENLNIETTEGSWCYKSQAANCQKYGRLYNYTTAQNVCPAGWHLPNYTEYYYLMEYVGGEVAGFNKLKKGGSTGFNAVLSGWCINGSQDRDEYVRAYYWTSTGNYAFSVWDLGFNPGGTGIGLNTPPKEMGFSVRCIKD